jgi:Arc/MetJ family transcription regulator
MSIRLQVVMSQDEHDEVRAAAARDRLTVSEWVRRSLRSARGHSTPVPSRVREGSGDYRTGATDVSGRVTVSLDLKEELVEGVRQRYGQPNWRAAVEYALRRAAVRPMSMEEALAMRGAGWDGSLDELRSGDPGSPW